MAVIGIDEFAKYFAGYEDCYTIIGGAACEILMPQTPRDFRATNMDRSFGMQENYARL